MKNEMVPVVETLLMLAYVLVGVSFFVYFVHSLLVNLATAVAVSSELGLAL